MWLMMKRVKKAEATYPAFLNPNDRMIDAKVVAAMLDVSVDAVYFMRDSGELPAVTIGRHVRWRLGDIRQRLGMPPIPWAPLK